MRWKPVIFHRGFLFHDLEASGDSAVVLIPFVVGLVLWGSTRSVSLGIALVMRLALFEYFALGKAIGHRAYRFWTATCALVLVYVQWLATIAPVVRTRPAG